MYTGDQTEEAEARMYDNEDEGNVGGCWLRACHLFIFSCCLIVGCGIAIGVSTMRRDLEELRNIFIAIFVLGVVLAAATGWTAAFADHQYQNRYQICHLVYFLTCLACMDRSERCQHFRTLKTWQWRMDTSNVNGVSTVGKYENA